MAEHVASSSSDFNYDVFLSFRGDKRYTFTGHLYRALDKTKRINVFRDDPSLRLGDEIGATLREAIEKSRMSIVVLCQNYASSSWCLDELVHIMKCSENGRKRPVLPVFYHVEPTEVRYQKNQYEAAMRKHEERHSNKVKTWRSALFAVCELSGKHCTEERYEADIVDQIVKEVLIRIPPEPLYIKHPTGSAFRFEGVKSLLDLESHNNVCMVGIYHDSDEIDIKNFAGMLYNEVREQFDAASFLSSVGEKSGQHNWGLENLQQTLLSEMGEEGTKRGSIFKGSSEIKQKLGSKRVLLILDDVDNINQLEALAGGGNWFGPGSRIIVTTRDKDVLDNYELEDGLEMRLCCIGDESEFEGNVKKEYENAVGLEKDFEIVINQLKEEGSPENVVSIIGMGGLGKTTLAQKIYNSDEVKKLFRCRAWATVSKDFSGKEAFKSLLKCLKPSTYKSGNEDSRSEEELKQKVRKCLKGKKYLVVLDDVWDTNNPWGVLKGCFPDNKNGSMILLTTRDHRVANVSESKMPHHKLSFLDKEESWELFRNELFHSKKCPPELEAIGRSIAESCNGLPLAIKTTAGIVAKRDRSKDAWEGIMKLLPYWFAEDKEGKKMMEILKFSYDDLPNKMKPCFLYLGVFPEDAKIRVRELIELWIAEEFIKPIQTGRSKSPLIEPEDIGEQYFKELVDRNLVQVAKRRRDGSSVKTCKIHDLIRELCILVSNNSNNARRLSFPRDIGSYACSVTCTQSSTYSLFVYGDPKGWQHHIPKGCQVNALYLNYGKIAADLERLKSVRFLKMKSTYFQYELLFEFQSLQTLYAIVRKGKEIRHLLCEDKMQNVQTLYYVVADSQLRFLLDNRYFPNLRTLGLLITSDLCESIEENLRSLEHLSKLQKLKLQFWTTKRVPLDKIAFPSNLIKIVLSFCEGFNFQDMNALGRIRRLQILKLYGVKFTEEILNCGSAGSFPRLQLFIVKSVNVRRVTLEDGAMPRLRRAVFHYCPRLMRHSLPEKMLSLGSNLHFLEGYSLNYDNNIPRLFALMRSVAGSKNDDAHDDDDLLITQNRWMSRLRVFAVRSGWVLRKILTRR